MNRIARFLVVLGLSGCSAIRSTTPQLRADQTLRCDTLAAPVADTVIASAAAIVAIKLSLVTSDCRGTSGGGPESLACGAAGLGALAAMAIGVPYVVSAVTGYRDDARCRANNAKEHIAARRRAVRAVRLTNAAFLASRTGDCATVVELDGEVRALDPEFYASGFVSSESIRRCLARGSIAAKPYCFVETTSTQRVCLPTQDECMVGRASLPEPLQTTACTPRPQDPADAPTSGDSP